MKYLYYNVTVFHNRKWGFRIQWVGWDWLFTAGAAVNFLAPAIRVHVVGLSIWAGRIPKEKIIGGGTLVGVMKEEERKEE